MHQCFFFRGASGARVFRGCAPEEKFSRRIFFFPGSFRVSGAQKRWENILMKNQIEFSCLFERSANFEFISINVNFSQNHNMTLFDQYFMNIVEYYSINFKYHALIIESKWKCFFQKIFKIIFKIWLMVNPPMSDSKSDMFLCFFSILESGKFLGFQNVW